MLKRRKQSKSPCLTDAEPDRISCLPDHVIDQILSKLSIREAVRTSVLSSNWMCKWVTLPNIVIDTQCITTASQDPSVILGIVDHVLLLHFGPIKKFEFSNLCLIPATHIDHAKHIDRWTLHLIGRSIEDLVLTIWRGPCYTIPRRLFSCQSLRYLNLHNCWLKPPPAFEGLRNLKALYLDEVTIAQDAFENLISSCSLLEDMVLTDLDGITEFNIHAPNLKNLDIKGIFDDISFENTCQLVSVDVGCDSNESRLYGCSSNLLKFFAHLSDINNLHIRSYFLEYLAAGVVPVQLPSPCINLSHLYLAINFNDLKEISAALCVLRSSPNLRGLEIYARPSEQTVASYCTEDIFYDWPAMQVRHVSIDGFSGIKSEIDFIRFVLLYSSVLQRMTVEPVLNIGSEFTKELLKFKRASGQAEVIFLEPTSMDDA